MVRRYIDAVEKGKGAPNISVLDAMTILRTFARNFSNIDFFLKLLPLKDDELAMSEM